MSIGLRDYIVESLGGEYPDPGASNIAVQCISCGRDKHMYVNCDNGLALCFRCGYTANLVKIVMDLEGVDYVDALTKSELILRGARKAKRGNVKFDAELSKSIRDAIDAEPSAVVATPELKLPRYCVPIDLPVAKRARRYLTRTRGIPEEKWRPYNLYYGAARDTDTFDIQYHIVFPEFSKRGELVYYTTRATYEPESGPKSRHPRDVKKTTLYGMGVVRDTQKWVILVEGPMDVLALSRNAVALLGKQITDGQMRTLKERFKHVYVCLDKEEKRDAWELAQQLYSNGIKVSVTHTPKKDAAESAELPVDELIDNLLTVSVPFTHGSYIKSRLQ